MHICLYISKIYLTLRLIGLSLLSLSYEMFTLVKGFNYSLQYFSVANLLVCLFVCFFPPLTFY